MIHKFPKLPKKNKEALIKWLDATHHEYMSNCHKYLAYGNKEAADNENSCASCIAYIKMMMEYHEED